MNKSKVEMRGKASEVESVFECSAADGGSWEIDICSPVLIQHSENQIYIRKLVNHIFFPPKLQSRILSL